MAAKLTCNYYARTNMQVNMVLDFFTGWFTYREHIFIIGNDAINTIINVLQKKPIIIFGENKIHAFILTKHTSLF